MTLSLTTLLCCELCCEQTLTQCPLFRRLTAYDSHNATIVNLCSGGEAVWVHDVVYPIYSFLQLYVIYKFGNVIVNKNKILARFAFMHCIGASLCFWIYTIKNETLDSYIEKFYHHTSAESCRAHVDNSSDEHIFNTKRSGFPDVWDDPDSDVTTLQCHHDYTSVVNVHHGLSCVVDTHHWCLEIDQKAEDIFRLDDKKK